MTLSWSQPAGSVGPATENKYWNYAGSPVTTNLTTTPVSVLPAVAKPRAISFSADGADGTIIKIWINADPATEPPTLKSYPGHNAFDWPVSGAVSMAVISGSATVTIDVAEEIAN